ncbi:sensor domain-containing diguanylate cyclase [Cellulomonas endophytica]|uniref:GGDEF domain-containing protein n=1 Tax=Cellulomonas endophytica TaxID=2494735 RepID=UPI0010135E68|nr:GGDEF domain-containing protein [Cellulomonas endophytica]
MLRPPTGLVARTRWLYLLAGLASLLLVAPGLVHGATPVTLAALVAGTVLLSGAWVLRSARPATGAWLGVVEAVALGVFLVACPEPAMVFAVVFPALWYRAVFGTTRGVVAYGVGASVALVAATPVWGLVPGRGSAPFDAVVPTLPIMLMTVLVARHLALGLFAREQAKRRDAALARLGTALIGERDREEILRLTGATADALCDATPGLRLLVARAEADGLVVARTAGPWRAVPERLPLGVLPPGAAAAGGRAALRAVGGAGDGAETVTVLAVADDAALADAAGEAVRWSCLPLPDGPGLWQLVGVPAASREEALTAVRSLSSHVVLALATSAAHEALARQAATDTLTGLADRAEFHRLVAEHLAAPGAAGAVLFLDLDDFKRVNDTRGHAAGDEVLRTTAHRLRHATAPGDVCARLGGDEFAVLLRPAPGRPVDDALVARLAERLVALVAAPVPLTTGAVRVGVSIGTAPLAPGLPDGEALHRADLAMYAAKAAGKNRTAAWDAGPALAGRRAG